MINQERDDWREWINYGNTLIIIEVILTGIILYAYYQGFAQEYFRGFTSVFSYGLYIAFLKVNRLALDRHLEQGEKKKFFETWLEHIMHNFFWVLLFPLIFILLGRYWWVVISFTVIILVVAILVETLGTLNDREDQEADQNINKNQRVRNVLQQVQSITGFSFKVQSFEGIYKGKMGRFSQYTMGVIVYLKCLLIGERLPDILSDQEIKSVVLHECGHQVRRKQLIAIQIFQIFFFILVNFFLVDLAMRKLFGFDVFANYEMLMVYSLLFSTLFQCIFVAMELLFAFLHRREELLADTYSAHHGYAYDLIKSLHIITNLNIDPEIDKAKKRNRYSLMKFFNSHPSVAQRARVILAADKERLGIK